MVEKNGSRASRGNLMRTLGQILEQTRETNILLKRLISVLTQKEAEEILEKQDGTQKRGASKNYINKAN